MQTFGNQRLPWILVTLLVALNVLVLVLVWFRPPQQVAGFGPPPHPPHGRPHGLAGEIGLKEEQMEKFMALQKPHFERMDGYRNQIVAARLEAFKEFGKPGQDTAVVKAAFAKIGQAQAQAEMDRYQHFMDVLALCNPEQAAHFIEILPKILSRPNQPENRPMGHHGPDGPGGPPH
ncbi:MAG: periplasmic heavy metal sensor [Bacteroidia bacterium]